MVYPGIYDYGVKKRFFAGLERKMRFCYNNKNKTDWS
jgi:hypothetical protein